MHHMSNIGVGCFEKLNDMQGGCSRPPADSTGVQGKSGEGKRRKSVPWTEDEHRRFLVGLQMYGRGDWRGISRYAVISKTPAQVASHAQKYYLRLNSEKKRSSIHDVTIVEGTTLLRTPEFYTGETTALNGYEAPNPSGFGQFDHNLLVTTPVDAPGSLLRCTVPSISPCVSQESYDELFCDLPDIEFEHFESPNRDNGGSCEAPVASHNLSTPAPEDARGSRLQCTIPSTSPCAVQENYDDIFSDLPDIEFEHFDLPNCEHGGSCKAPVASHNILTTTPEDARSSRLQCTIPSTSPSAVQENNDDVFCDLADLELGHFELPNYQHGGSCKAPVAFHKLLAATPEDASGSWSQCTVASVSPCVVQEAVAASVGSNGKSSLCKRKKGIPWTEEEHRRFLVGLEKYGKGNWKSISTLAVISKTPTQVASHAQKYYMRLSSEKKRSSIHDITTVDDTIPLQTITSLEGPSSSTEHQQIPGSTFPDEMVAPDPDDALWLSGFVHFDFDVNNVM
ncbi:unnamed protein product [Victoria cruziana]